MNYKERPILIILIAGIGDLILASKSFRAIKNGNPNADIHLLTSTEAFPIARNFPYIDRVWAFPIRELRERKAYIFDVLRLVRELRKIDFNLIVNLYRIFSWRGAIRLGLLFLHLKAQSKVGQGYKGFGLFIDRKAPPGIFRDHHMADAMEEIALLAGGIRDDKGVEVYWDRTVQNKWDYLFSSQNRGKTKLIGINPGGARYNRRWEPKRYAWVAEQLNEQYCAEIVLLGGPGEENLAAEIQKNMKRAATNLAGKLTLNDLVYIISRLDLLLTNDSGPMHIAAAIKTPVVAIFGPEDPRFFGPYTSHDLYRLLYKDIDCQPCKKKDCKRPLCLDQITPEEVFEKCVEIVNRDDSSLFFI